MATTRNRKSAAKTTAKPKYDPADLPETGTKQYRQGGEYKAPLKGLAAFAKGNTTLTGHVKALVHLGWVKPGGVNDAAKSPAFTYADNADLPESSWAVGEAAGPQISANLQALAEAGAPVDDLDGLWTAYVGV